MTLQQLVHFRAVLAHGGFGAAGRALGLTQQAVSRSVRMLEDELGRKLIERGPSNLAPTREGEVVLSLASEMLEQVEEMRRLADGPETVHTRLRVGMSYWYSLTDVSGAILAAIRRSTNAEIELVPGSARNFAAQIAAREIDFALCGEPKDGATLDFTPMIETRWGVAASKAYAPDRPEDWEWVLDASDTGEAIAREVAEAFGLSALKVRLRTGLPAFALRALVDESAVCVAPLSLDPTLLTTLGLELRVPKAPPVVMHGLLKPRRSNPLIDWAALQPALETVHREAASR
ncbi:MAG: LysR family transcriptional regulator [Oceanicaulis sp.]